jgi:hypothetical protein
MSTQFRLRSVSAIRKDWCGAKCGVRIERGDRVIHVSGCSVHLACYDGFRAERASTMTEARREIFWTVACPACGAAALVPCSEDGVTREKNHRERMVAYSAAKAEGQCADPVKLANLKVARRGLTVMGARTW